jgi:thiamine transport system permease protein
MDQRLDIDRPRMSRRRGIGMAALAAIPVAFLAIFFVWPVSRIVVRGLRPDGNWDFSSVGEVLGNAVTRRVIWFTIWQAAASTLVTLALALPGAYVFARFAFRGKNVLRAAVTVPFVLPTIVVGSAFLALLGPRGVLGGWLSLDESVWAILLAHLFFNYAVIVRTVGGLWSHLDPALDDAARTLGASRWRALREVTWPLLRPAVISAAAIVYLFSFTSFGVILVLGGQDHATLEVAIKRATLDRLDLRTASVLALVQLVAVVVLLLVTSLATRRRSVQQRLLPVADASHRPRGGERWFLAANLAVIAVVLGSPMAVLVERSLHTSSGYGFGFYRALVESPRVAARFVPAVDAIRNSLAFATAATAMALIVGGIAAFIVAGDARRRIQGRGRGRTAFDLLLMLPLGTSAVTVGFGFLIALDRPIDLRSSWIIVPIAHSLVAIPFVVRILVPVLRSIDDRLRDAATVLGASPRRVWQEIDLPIVRRAALVAAGFAFAISLGEFGATLFIARPDRPTMPVAIFRYLSLAGASNFGAAMAMSTVLMVITAASIFLIERFRTPGLGEF